MTERSPELEVPLPPGLDAVPGDAHVFLQELLAAQAAAHVGSWSLSFSTGAVWWSPELYRIVGRDPSDFTPTVDSMLDHVHPDDRARVESLRTDALNGAAVTCVARIRKPEGALRWVEIRARATRTAAVPAGLAGTVFDVTERHHADAALRASEQRYRTMVETTREGVWAIDAAGVTTFVNDRMAEILGYASEEMIGVPLADFLDEDGKHLAAEYLSHERGGGSTHIDFRFVRRDATEVWTLLNAIGVFDEEGQYVGSFAMLTDITERKVAEASLAHSATHDALTGLPNRALLVDRLDVALARLARRGSMLAVMYCDLDQFKFINDSLGHDAGDQLLATVAGRLNAAVRPGDTVARIGGDEFVVCCEDLEDEDAAAHIAARIARSLAKPVVIDGREVFTSASVGVRLAHSDEHPSAELIRDADAAMYKAKEAGRNSFFVFDDRLRSRAAQRLEIESGLHHALERDELRVYYQPTVDLVDESVTGFEALVRWEVAPGSVRLPAEFITIAEETGLIVPIGLFVLEQACRQCRLWHSASARPLTLAVNLSARQLHSSQLVERVAGILDATGMPAGQLCLELTESSLMRDHAAAEKLLSALKELGLRLAIDDFGTGYSSLSYLRRFPIDILKIDKSFIAQLGSDAESTAIVTSVIHLAKSLGLEIVAEGVEEREQMLHLKALGCERAQGYLWGRPLPPQEIEVRFAVTAATPVPRGGAATRGVIRVLVADDEVAHRGAVTRILERTGRFAVIGEAGDGQEAVALARELRPDLVVLDLAMPKMDGLEALPRILATSPETKIALLSGHLGSAPTAGGAALHLRKGLKPSELVEHLLFLMHEPTRA